MAIQQFNETYPISAPFQFLAADGTGDKVIVNSNPVPVRIDALIATNSDAIAHVVRVKSAAFSLTANLGSVSVPAGAGTLGTPGIDLLAGALPATTSGLVLDGSTSLYLALEVAMTGATHLDVTPQGGNL